MEYSLKLQIKLHIQIIHILLLNSIQNSLLRKNSEYFRITPIVSELLAIYLETIF